MWGYSLFNKVASQVQEEVGKIFIDTICTMVHLAYTQSLVMISSYSLDPDVLSQWRAYADDGRGFAIGFSSNLIDLLPLNAPVFG